MTQARIYNQLEVRYCPHTSVSGETMQRVKAGTCTSSGASDGTTLIDTGSGSGAAKTYNGRYGVLIRSGTCLGQFCRIVGDDGSGTLTLEGNGFSAQIASGVQYEIMAIPDPCVVVQSSSGETNMVDSTRSEASNGDAAFWIGYYACVLSGTYRGKTGLITGFVPGTGTFTMAAGIGGALSAGDVVVLRKFIEVKGLSLPEGPAYHPRPQFRSNFAVGDGVLGARAGGCNFNTQVYPSGSLAASASAANPSVLSGLFQAAGLVETVSTSVTVDTGSTTTAVKITTGTHEKIAVGSMVIWKGNASFVTSKTDGGASADTITVSPPFPTAPVATDTLYASRMYAKTTTGDVYGVLVEAEIDGITMTMVGCKGNVDRIDGQPPEFAWKFSVDHWWEMYQAAPWNAGSMFTSATPVLTHERRCYLDATATDVAGFTASPNTAVAPRPVSGALGVNGRAGFQVTDASKAGGTFRELSAVGGELVQTNKFLARTAMAFSLVEGTHGTTFGCRMPVAKIKAYPKPTNAGGLVEFPEVVEAQDAGTASDGTTTPVKMPDFAFHLS